MRKFGAIKIVPPKEWKPNYVFKFVNKPLTTRVQILQDLLKAKVTHFILIFYNIISILIQIYFIQWKIYILYNLFMKNIAL
jgi:hypothetical protein